MQDRGRTDKDHTDARASDHPVHNFRRQQMIEVSEKLAQRLDCIAQYPEYRDHDQRSVHMIREQLGLAGERQVLCGKENAENEKKEFERIDHCIMQSVVQSVFRFAYPAI